MVATVNSTGTSTGVVITPDSSGVLALQTAGTTAITIDASQNVGIGTTTLTNKLNVAGAINSSAALTAIGANTVALSQESGFARLAAFGPNSSTSGTLYLYTINSAGGGQGGAIIDSSGNLLVATTNTVPGNGSGNNVAGFAVSTNGTTWASRSGFEALSVNRVDTTGGVLRVASAGTQVGGISVTASATSYNTSSDYRLKENITPMTGALNKVSQLKPVTYKWKFDGADGEGFIAHELQEVVPDCVTGEKDGVETYTDEDGNEQTRPKYQGVDTSFLVATLTAAIQELKALTDTQASTITALTARITALENK